MGDRRRPQAVRSRAPNRGKSPLPSRHYYATFHKCRPLAQAEGLFKDAGGVHAGVIDALTRGRDRKLQKYRLQAGGMPQGTCQSGLQDRPGLHGGRDRSDEGTVSPRIPPPLVMMRTAISPDFGTGNAEDERTSAPGDGDAGGWPHVRDAYAGCWQSRPFVSCCS